MVGISRVLNSIVGYKANIRLSNIESFRVTLFDYYLVFDSVSVCCSSFAQLKPICGPHPTGKNEIVGNKSNTFMSSGKT